jgi:thiazole synthase
MTTAQAPQAPQQADQMTTAQAPQAPQQAEGAVPATDALRIAGRPFTSRLVGGTGKFSSGPAMRDALAASATELVTVALRRVDLDAPHGEDILDYLERDRYVLMPNTSGAENAEEAVRLARLARAAEITDEAGRTWIKLEITPDPRWLLPDPVETLRAAEMLVREGFVVLPYMGADPILAKRLEDAGCATVMPMGSWIGSNLGLRTRDAVEIIIEQATVPVIVDAGLGAPSHAADAMEIGCDAVLVNTAIATAADPVLMASAFALAVRAGRTARLAGLAATGTPAASSPMTGFLSREPDVHG